VGRSLAGARTQAGPSGIEATKATVVARSSHRLALLALVIVIVATPSLARSDPFVARHIASTGSERRS